MPRLIVYVARVPQAAQLLAYKPLAFLSAEVIITTVAAIMVKRVGAVEARTKLEELLAQAQYVGERFIITKDGKNAAALLSVEELQRKSEKLVHVER